MVSGEWDRNERLKYTGTRRLVSHLPVERWLPGLRVMGMTSQFYPTDEVLYSSISDDTHSVSGVDSPQRSVCYVLRY